LHAERFVDQPPRQVWATLLDEGVYHASPSTMYRILAGLGETKDRRNQRPAQRNAIPRLEATAPNQVWTWDISKLPTTTPGKFLNLYLILDLFSRFPVGWMVAEHENSALAKQLIAETFVARSILPDTLTLHNDRGAPMTALAFIDLLGELGVKRSVSRPRVSNDNAFSESMFKTTKQQPDYPGCFTGLAHARRWLTEFFAWYSNVHRHSALGFFTPADVYFDRVPALAEVRQKAFDGAYLAHPERFIRRPPRVAMPPAKVAINPAPPSDESEAAAPAGPVFPGLNSPPDLPPVPGRLSAGAHEVRT
jgi:putative transposase